MRVWWLAGRLEVSPAAGNAEKKGFFQSGRGVTWSSLIGCSHVFGRRAMECWASFSSRVVSLLGGPEPVLCPRGKMGGSQAVVTFES